MRLRAVLWLFCSAIITLGFAQPKQPSTANASKSLTLFRVNKKPVTTDEFIYLYRKNHQHAPDDFTEAKIEEYLTLYINFKLKVEEALQRGMDTTTAFKTEFRQYKEELRKPYLPGHNITDSLVRLTYARMKEEVRAAHILVSVDPNATPDDTLRAYNKILELRNRIMTGEDFGKSATAFSDDPSAKMNQGDLGYFTALQMVYPFENAAYSTPVGEITEPVRTRFGYHILKVMDRRPAQGEVAVAHIMVRTGEDKNNTEAKNTIFQVYDQLRAGMPWNDLCKQYSEDPGTKDNGGRLRPFGTGMMNSAPEFERVAFELQEEGQVSDPFQTRYGWHIIKLERRIPLASFEEMEPTLKNRINRDERAEISKQALQWKLRNDARFEEDNAVRQAVLEQADSTLQKGNWQWIAPDPDKTLFSLKDTPVSVQEFVKYVQQHQTANRNDPRKYLEELYNNFVDARILQLLEEDIIAKNPEYGYLLNEYYEGILLFEIMEKEVWNKASEDSLGQYGYYKRNGAKYQAPERVKAVFYSAASRDAVDPVKALIEAGDQRKIQEYVIRNKVRTESGYYTKKDKVILQQVPWEKGIYPAENNEMFYLAWLKEILPAGGMSFEEARPSVVSDYQTFLEQKWVDELKKKYPVKVNGKGRKYILQQLQKN